MLAKPPGPRPYVYHPGELPSYWAYLGGPSRTYASDTGDVADLAGGARAGTRQAGVAWAPSALGPCLSCDGGANGYVSVPDAAAFNPAAGEQFAVSLWVNPAAALSGAGQRTLLDHRDNASTGNGWALAYYFGTLILISGFNLGGPTVTFPAATWTHLACAFAGTGATFYANGASLGTFAVGAMTSFARPLYVGGADDGTRFTGLIGDVRVRRGKGYAAAAAAREYSDPWAALRRPSNRRAFTPPAAAVTGGMMLGC